MNDISLRPNYGKTVISGSPPNVSACIIQTDKSQEDNSVPTKFIYDRAFLKKFQGINDPPSDIQRIYNELPDLKPAHRKIILSNNEDNKQQRGKTSPQSQHKDVQKQPQKEGQKQIHKQNKKSLQTQQQADSTQNLTRKTSVPWNPQFFVNEKEQILRTIQGTLNKLTPDSFDKLSNKIADMVAQIKDEELYEEAVSMVFLKAVGEINFTRLYSLLCAKLRDTQPKLEDPKVSFRGVLLNKCQKEFEAANSERIEEANLPQDPEERAAIKEKERRRKIGNVKFIGELFKTKLVTEKIVFDCINGLFSEIINHKTENEKAEREFNAELSCKLLTTIGRDLDTPQAKNWMDTYFSYISKFSTDPDFSSRIRFMFQDLQDLRSGGWVPRRQENTPKTISEVHEAFDDFGGLTTQLSPRFTATQITKLSETKTPAKPKKKKKSKSKSTKPEAIKIDEPVFISSVKEYEEKLTPIIQKYLKDHEIKPACTSITELDAPEYQHKITEIGINLTLEKSDKERNLISKLFGNLYENKVLNEENFIKGISPIIKSLADLVIDIPFASKYIENFLNLAISQKIISKKTAISTFPDLK